jgi:predicted nucleic acid-binding protein
VSLSNGFKDIYRCLSFKFGGFSLGLNLGRMGASSELLGNAFAFSLERGVSYHDGVYIWSSKSMDAPLLTADGRQLEAAKGVVSAIHLKDFKLD